MPTSTRADKAANASRQGEAIRDDLAGKPQLPQSDRADQLFTLRPEGRGLTLVTRRPPYWTVLARDSLVAPVIGQKGRQVR